jgi:hypothetical protein
MASGDDKPDKQPRQPHNLMVNIFLTLEIISIKFLNPSGSTNLTVDDVFMGGIDRGSGLLLT